MAPWTKRLGWIEGYYLATPVFAVVDWQFGANVRAVGLADHPEWRAFYYAICLGCGILALARPAWGSLVGLVETSANLLILALSLFLPMYALADRILDGVGVVSNPITPAFALNLTISGMVWVALFYARGGLPGAASGRLRA